MKLIDALLIRLLLFVGTYFHHGQSKTVFNSKKTRKVLVYAYTGLGNFLLFTPALKAIKNLLPHADFTLLHGNDTGCHEVIGKELFNNSIIIKRDADWLTRARWIYRIRKEKFDLIISDFHSNKIFLIYLTLLAGSQYRLGHISSIGWENPWDWIYNIPAVMHKDQHEIDRYLELAYALGVTKQNIDKNTFISLNHEDEDFAKRFLSSYGIKSGSRIVSVQIGTSPKMRWKQWNPENYKELCDKLSDLPSTKIILHGSPGETDLIKMIAEQMKHKPIIAAGRTSVKQAAAIIKESDLLVCNDSGLMHIGVAVTTPVIAIYGPTDFKRTAPIGEKHTVIRQDLDCSPCFLMDWEKGYEKCPFDYKCLHDISVDKVFEVVIDKLDNRFLKTDKIIN